jgi:hypothetical protein
MGNLNLKNFDIVSGVEFKVHVSGSFVEGRCFGEKKFLIISSETEFLAERIWELRKDASKFDKISEFCDLTHPERRKRMSAIVRVSRLKEGASYAELTRALNGGEDYSNLTEPQGEKEFVEILHSLWGHGTFPLRDNRTIVEKWWCSDGCFKFEKLEGNLGPHIRNYGEGGFPLRETLSSPNRKF